MARVKAGDESSDLSDVPSETETRTNRRKVKKPSDEKPYVLLDDDDDDPDDDGQADQEDQGASSDSDEDFKLGARSRKNGKKPARKRARASTGQPAKPRKSATTGKLIGNRGKLGDIIHLPVETIGNVMCYLQPMDLLRLSRTSRFFRTALLRRSSAYIWKSARQNVPDELPDLPDGMSEPAFASLTFDRTCQSCGKKGCQSVIWKWHARVCKACISEQCVNRVDVANDFPDLANFAISHYRHWNQFWKPSLEAMQAHYEKVIQQWEEQKNKGGDGDGKSENGQEGVEQGVQTKADDVDEEQQPDTHDEPMQVDQDEPAVESMAQDAVEEPVEEPVEGAIETAVDSAAQTTVETNTETNADGTAVEGTGVAGASASAEPAPAAGSGASGSSDGAFARMTFVNQAMSKYKQALVSFDEEMSKWELRQANSNAIKHEELADQRRDAIIEALVDEGYHRIDFAHAHWFTYDRLVNKKQKLTPRIWATIKDDVKALVDRHIESRRDWKDERNRWKHRLEIGEQYDRWARTLKPEQSAALPHRSDFYRLPSVHALCDSHKGGRLGQDHWEELLPKLQEDLARWTELVERSLVKKVLVSRRAKESTEKGKKQKDAVVPKTEDVDQQDTLTAATATATATTTGSPKKTGEKKEKKKEKGKGKAGASSSAPAAAAEVGGREEMEDVLNSADRRRAILHDPTTWFSYRRQIQIVQTPHAEAILAWPALLRRVHPNPDGPHRAPQGLQIANNVGMAYHDDTGPAPAKMKPFEMGDDKEVETWDVVKFVDVSENARKVVGEMMKRGARVAKGSAPSSSSPSKKGDKGEGGSKQKDKQKEKQKEKAPTKTMTREELDALGPVFECRTASNNSIWLLSCGSVGSRMSFSQMACHVVQEHHRSGPKPEACFAWHKDGKRPTVVDEMKEKVRESKSLFTKFDKVPALAGCGICAKGRVSPNTVAWVKDHIKKEHGFEVGADEYNAIVFATTKVHSLLSGIASPTAQAGPSTAPAVANNYDYGLDYGYDGYDSYDSEFYSDEDFFGAWFFY